MAYSVTIFRSTGFNAVNIPDSEATLISAAVSYDTLPAIDTLQERFLSSIRVRAQWASVKDADYCKIGDWFYFVVGVRMLAGDVAELSLLPDFILSAGGISSLVFLDGVTERVHVPSANDDFGAYTEDDPLMTPAEPLGIDIEDVGFTGSTYTIIESAIDLEKTGDILNPAHEAITYTDANTGDTVTVPTYESLDKYTNHQYGGSHKTASYIVPSSGSAVETWQRGIDIARALGVESAIIGQYNVPVEFFASGLTPASGMVTTLAARDVNTGTNILYILYSTAKNARMNYGQFTKYGLLTAGGNRAEFNAEDIYDSNESAPVVRTKADLRKDGCPYHRFETYLGDKSGFWRNCLAGAEWEQVPMVYTAKSGGALERMQFQAERDVAGAQYERSRNMTIAQGTANTIRGAMEQAGRLNIIGAVGAAIGGGVTTGVDVYNQYMSFKESEELAALKYATGRIVAPDIQFPYNTDIMRDALNNGFLVYRYHYSASDAARIDKLLTMYGYRYTKSLEASDFTNRAKFNFVRADGISVQGKSNISLPRWWNDGIAAQIASGVRVWHVSPAISAYTDGSNT